MLEKLGLPQLSTQAPAVDNAYYFILISSIFLLIATTTAMLYFAWTYRESKVGKNAKVPYMGGHHLFEIIVSTVCGGFFLLVFVWGMIGFYSLYDPPKDTYDINVTGQKWQWITQYANGKTLTNELVIPKDTNIKLILTSKDVIHSFYLPEFRIKQDAVPGHYTSLWFRATKVAEGRIFCAEFCGTEHSGMIGKVRILEPSAFKAWLNGVDISKRDVVLAGKDLFQKRNCVACHSVNGSGKSHGPSLGGIFGSAVTLASGEKIERTEDYVRQSITNPGGQVVKGYKSFMPTYKGLLSEDDLGALVAYIKSLKE